MYISVRYNLRLSKDIILTRMYVLWHEMEIWSWMRPTGFHKTALVMRNSRRVTE
jgi:hypothetical protein